MRKTPRAKRADKLTIQERLEGPHGQDFEAELKRVRERFADEEVRYSRPRPLMDPAALRPATSPTDERNLFIYNERVKGTIWPQILSQVEERWPGYSLKRPGAIDALRRFVKAHPELPSPPPGKPRSK